MEAATHGLLAKINFLWWMKKMSHPKKTETSNDFETIAVAHFMAVKVSLAASKFLLLL